jgi:hypothetical protein
MVSQAMQNEPSGEYYDYTKTMKPERPYMLPWRQKYVCRIMHATRSGTGTYSAVDEFLGVFYRQFLPWFNKNHPAGAGDVSNTCDGTDICMPVRWRQDPTLLAYSVDGYDSKTWQVPEAWRGVETVYLRMSRKRAGYRLAKCPWWTAPSRSGRASMRQQQ